MPKSAVKRTATFAPKGWHTVTPRIVVRDSRQLVTFMKRAFDASGTYHREFPSEIRMGDSIVMISEAGERAARAAFLYVYVKDVDATYARALRAGARSIETPAEMAYGDRRCMVEDKWGNWWQIATRQPRR